VYILGVGQIGGADSSAVLLKDGKIVFAVEEERLSRAKHAGGFPEKAIACCLEAEGITLADVDHIAIVDEPWLRFVRRTTQWYAKALFSHPTNALYHVFHDEVPVLLEFLKRSQQLRQGSRGRAKLSFVKHHTAHMASAFLVSPFEEAAVFTADARGEVATTTTGIGVNNRLTVLEEQRMPHSLGVFYAAITDYLGFRFNEDEYKVMGLAAYGQPEYLDIFRKMIRHDKQRLIMTDLDYFAYQTGRGLLSQKFLKIFGPQRQPDEPVTAQHQNIAASAQAVLEEIALQIAKALQVKTGMKNLCLAGGVAFNCVMNGKIQQAGIFDQVFVQPAAGDAGGALGAAHYIYNCVLGHPRTYVMKTAFLGPGYSDAQIEQELILSKAKYRRSSNIMEETAAHLAKGQVVGWFQGRMEFGPRALGARSILADPTHPEMRDRVNASVKHREGFRPFAPAVKSAKAAEYFKIDFDSPFMLFVVDVLEDKKSLLPAITHVDGTARVQSVNEQDNPKLWGLLDAFERLKGVPILMNTSFNVMGEPIVCTPHEAIRCFYSTGLDVLAIGDFMVSK